MRSLIESTIVSIDGIVESPDQWAPFDEEAVEYSMNELDNYEAFVMGHRFANGSVILTYAPLRPAPDGQAPSTS